MRELYDFGHQTIGDGNKTKSVVLWSKVGVYNEKLKSSMCRGDPSLAVFNLTEKFDRNLSFFAFPKEGDLTKQRMLLLLIIAVLLNSEFSLFCFILPKYQNTKLRGT